ncbi:hypothetical protein HOD96_01150 [Candidatus Falkowbacteria bacterium]|jgi:cytochrome bd-type quinol oxidase subunit 2|nr:hypothetical protein [Candidatus Falkowbacteria bacterium]MBT4432926.1 hypothetical protein [Candidatus Falkowbacteria bacterium]
MFNFFQKILFIIIITVFLLSPNLILLEAADLTNLGDFLNNASSGAGFDTTNNEPEPIFGKIIKTLLSFLGIVFFLLVIYGGFIWMTAEGNTDRVDKARKIIVNSAVGLTIVMFAYAIVWLVVDSLISATGYTN